MDNAKQNVSRAKFAFLTDSYMALRNQTISINSFVSVKTVELLYLLHYTRLEYYSLLAACIPIPPIANGIQRYDEPST